MIEKIMSSLNPESTFENNYTSEDEMRTLGPKINEEIR